MGAPRTLARGEASENAPAVPRRWRALANWAGGTALALLLAEVAMRFYAFAPRVMDGPLGFVPRPGSTARWYSEGSASSHWEEHGLRRQDNPAGAPALLMLGDSITEAMQVDDDHTFSARLSVHLRTDGRPMAVRNLGIAGASIARYAALAPEYRRLFDPRWTVVQFDDDDLEKALSPLETHFVRDAPDGPLRIVELAAGHGGSFRLRTRMMRAQSALFQRATVQLMGFADEWRRWRPFRADAPPPAPVVPAATKLPIEEELDALATAYGGRITFLYIAALDPAHPDEPRGLERRIEEICERRGFSLVNARQVFPELVRRGLSPFGLPNAGFNTGHLNEEGHEALSREIAREIERLAALGLL